PCFGEHRDAHVQRRVDDDDRRDVRHDVADNDAPVAHAHIACGGYEFAFAQTHRHAAHDAGADHPAERGEQDDQPNDVTLRSLYDDCDQQKTWHHEHEVDNPHQCAIPPAAEIACYRSHRRGDDGRDERHTDADQHGFLHTAQGLGE